ncbi:Fe-S cluster assembly sulfur transfer protein SufU [Methylotenera mobilis]|uniref:SUF system FeS assembly protein, NifU family n=1 Tax=Methylotenera mobilis (strain JLW8 / ATCC BAA-1282 / DSM 17540) TaxID=583345 RepID=C6WVT3_METML|nr:SUF system NifU family Fe-S cluster assembly protein [Methylotenera mobilis]ACT48032.1 SUF system FeS assembly protein, NifU family [Methylotenera mobilis JLW8]
MNDLRDLYQDMIFDHYRQPRNYGRLAHANHTAEGYNPLCGDKVSITLILKDGVIHDLKFEGVGCAISTASASLMTESLKGKTEAEALGILEDFKSLVTGSSVARDMGKLSVLAGVQAFPQRVKCATLAWHTLQAALKNNTEPVSTE